MIRPFSRHQESAADRQPRSRGAEDYLTLAEEIVSRRRSSTTAAPPDEAAPPSHPRIVTGDGDGPDAGGDSHGDTERSWKEAR